jgi:tRNA dimethylallyltransferase
MDREQLYNRINKRVNIMIQNSLLDEAKSLLKHRNKNSLQTVGYKELFEYFDGKYNQEEAIDMIKQNTRRFAKRQISWFKRDHTIKYFSTNQTKEILKFIG